MNIPYTTKFTLKRIVENLDNIHRNGLGEDVQKLTPEQKSRLLELASTFENFGECLKNEDAVVNSARGLQEFAELAELYALNECSEAFQRNIVEKDMKELKKRVLEHTKIATECYARMQQLGVSYQDIGHILGRYYDLKTAKKMDQNYTKPQPLQTEGDTVCAWCKPDSNTRMIKQNSHEHEADSHGICPTCLQRMEAEVPQAFSKMRTTGNHSDARIDRSF